MLALLARAARTHAPPLYGRALVSCAHLAHASDDGARAAPEIPRDKIEFRFSRSSGPGGQNVNKVSTKAELRFVVQEASWLADDVRERFALAQANRINKAGEFVLTCSEHRTQQQNIKECLAKLRGMLAQAAVPPKERLATQPPTWAKAVQRDEKQARAKRKTSRQAVSVDY